MRNNRLIYAICGLLAIGMVSCLPDVRMEQKQGEAYRNIGEAYMEQKDYTSALKQFLQAEKLYPDDPQRLADQGEHRFRLCLWSEPGLMTEKIERFTAAFLEPCPVIREGYGTRL